MAQHCIKYFIYFMSLMKDEEITHIWNLYSFFLLLWNLYA